MLSDDELPPLPDYLSPGTVREYARTVERAAYAKAEKRCRDISNACDAVGADAAAATASVCADAIRALGGNDGN